VSWLRSPGLKEKLLALEARVEAINAPLTTAAPAPVRLNPNLSEFHRRKVTELAVMLADPAIAQHTREVIRGLIERGSVRWEGGHAVMILDGALAGVGWLGAKRQRPSVSWAFGGLSKSSLNLVAGAGFEPAAFRL
jgi:site-specific DNA recombinase